MPLRGVRVPCFRYNKKQSNHKCDYSALARRKGLEGLRPSRSQARWPDYVRLRRDGVRVQFTFQNKKIKQPPKWLLYFGALEGTRTPDLLVRSQSLYPTELPAQIMERMTRLELATSTLARWRSTRWATSANANSIIHTKMNIVKTFFEINNKKCESRYKKYFLIFLKKGIDKL